LTDWLDPKINGHATVISPTQKEHPQSPIHFPRNTRGSYRVAQTSSYSTA
jgi:hypothetical protein